MAQRSAFRHPLLAATGLRIALASGARSRALSILPAVAQAPQRKRARRSRCDWRPEIEKRARLSSLKPNGVVEDGGFGGLLAQARGALGAGD